MDIATQEQEQSSATGAIRQHRLEAVYTPDCETVCLFILTAKRNGIIIV